MKQRYTQILLFIGILSLLIMPNPALAAPAAVLSAEPSTGPSADGIAFRVTYNAGQYEVYMRPTVNVTGPALTLTAQVTLKVPHRTGADRFSVASMASTVAGTEWTESSRIDAPIEDINADYISFTLVFADGNHQAIAWQANEEIKLFSFGNAGTCQGAVGLLSNDDPFTSDIVAGRINSATTNPGNQIDVLNLGEGNLYSGNYGSTADCANRNVELQDFLYLPFISNK